LGEDEHKSYMKKLFPWLREGFDAPQRVRARRAGYLYGDPEGEKWTGYLELAPGVRTKIKGEYPLDYERMLEIEFEDDRWYNTSQPRVLFMKSGTKTYRGLIMYNEYVKAILAMRMIKIEASGEWASFTWHYPPGPRVMGRQQIAFGITVGGKERSGRSARVY